MTGKKQPFKRTRRGTKRCGWKRGPASYRRLFIYEMRRSNNVLAALSHAGVTMSVYNEWQESGYLTEAMLDSAHRIFKQRHPTVDIIVAAQDTTAPVDSTAATQGKAVTPVQGRGYDERTVLSEDGWLTSEGWDW